MVLAVLAYAATAYYVFQPSPSGIVGCTQEAKICPDGSSVSRVGPNCEFAACPNTNTSTEITSFEECVAAGNPVAESYPRQCIAEGQTFTEAIDTNANQNTNSAKDATKDWKTYENQEWGFRFQYPPSLYAIPTLPVESSVVSLSEHAPYDTNVSLGVAGTNEFTVAIVPQSLEIYRKESKLNYSKEIIGGRNGYISTKHSTFEDTGQTVIVDFEGKTLVISASGDRLEVLPTILSTFTFNDVVLKTHSHFQNAMNQNNFNAMREYFANAVDFAIGGTECCEIMSPAGAAAQMTYFSGVTSFNFSPEQVVAGKIKTYLNKWGFGDGTIGVATTKEVMAYHVNTAGKVDRVYLNKSYELMDVE